MWFLVPLMYLMLYTGNHATKVMENARVMEVTVTENARFTEGHGIRRDMGYGGTWDMEEMEDAEDAEDDAWRVDCIVRMGYIRALGISHV